MDALATVVFIFSYVFSLLRISTAVDTINVNQHIRDGETITSAGGTFQLGFFSPGDSKNRYLGIWYKKVAPQTVVWVANRESPLTDSSGVLKVTQQGILVVVSGTNGILWNSNSSRSAQDPNAQLLESGNLVMRNGYDSDPENFLWQSFDYPCDTLLPGMKFGRNRVTGLDRYLSSWTSADDPSKGNFTYGIDLSGFPQLLLRNGLAVEFRAGPWNVNSVIMRLVLTPDGYSRRFTWTDQKNEWTVTQLHKKDYCDNYAICGVYGIYWSNGCVRNTPWIVRRVMYLYQGEGSGCLLWFGDLIDIRDFTQNGQEFYVRMAASELGYMDHKSKEGENNEGQEHLDLPLFNLATLLNATNNFSDENKLGEGGFGPVYKVRTLHIEYGQVSFNLQSFQNKKNVMFSGIFQEGQEIAVKMMSKTSRQGLKEFKNEVESITKLQHRNLVKLLGCCIHGRERLLIYEYMPNKSLDLYIFGLAL
ncbi:G-type lectin S-receptor-like serine/threonine-protein kinase [Vitis vinifera]|uniref:G-type lectin S-receptor-like serine/threonine-protein kinase n=1 Tax=Vitis vinifera TaxID=29760 RepID=A0A438I425_VITVI|nr:G-type lectin S-receptor-like serine/threonine-protein kinase [Vitis vinifera]